MKQVYRFWEIDFLRGVAVIMMVCYHLIFDIDFFDVYNLDLRSLPFLFLLYPIGGLFLTLVGVSLHLSYSRVKNGLTEKQIVYKFLVRGLKILFLGFLISAATWVYLEGGWVVFGVLHCIGLSIIISIPLLKTNMRLGFLFLGIVFVVVGVILRGLYFDFYWFVWLGFTFPGFFSVDYFPFFPWFGVVLIGVFLGRVFYQGHMRLFSLRDLSDRLFIRFHCFLGRNSLFIYFIHQPVLVGLIQLRVVFS